MVKPQDIEDLALLLLYLSCWDDNPKKEYSKEVILRAWKGIPFEVLDILNEKELIIDKKGKAPVTLTDKGVTRAKELKKKFFGDADE